MVPASAASKNVFTCVTTLPRLPPRRRDADVVKSGALGDGGVVRAHEETDVDGIRECNAGESLRDERVADLRHRQDIDAIAPLEPDDGPVRQAVRRLLLFRDRAGRAPELPCSAAVTWALPGSSDGRIVQPIFRCASTPVPRKRARVETMKLPLTRFQTK